MEEKVVRIGVDRRTDLVKTVQILQLLLQLSTRSRVSFLHLLREGGSRKGVWVMGGCEVHPSTTDIKQVMRNADS